MSKFRKKPVVIEAIQWFPSDDDLPEGVSLDSFGRPYIETLEGRMFVSSGDWIIKGIKGEFYPCKADIFAATYEPVGNDDLVISVESWQGALIETIGDTEMYTTG
jgi:hypothetical protein